MSHRRDDPSAVQGSSGHETRGQLLHSLSALVQDGIYLGPGERLCRFAGGFLLSLAPTRALGGERCFRLSVTAPSRLGPEVLGGLCFRLGEAELVTDRTGAAYVRRVDLPAGKWTLRFDHPASEPVPYGLLTRSKLQADVAQGAAWLQSVDMDPSCWPLSMPEPRRLPARPALAASFDTRGPRSAAELDLPWTPIAGMPPWARLDSRWSRYGLGIQAAFYSSGIDVPGVAAAFGLAGWHGLWRLELASPDGARRQTWLVPLAGAARGLEGAVTIDPQSAAQKADWLPAGPVLGESWQFLSPAELAAAREADRSGLEDVLRRSQHAARAWGKDALGALRQALGL